MNEENTATATENLNVPSDDANTPSVVSENNAPPDDQESMKTTTQETVNMDALTDDERDSYLSIYRNMTDAEVAALPPSMRQEYYDIKAKLSAPAETQSEPDNAEPETEPESAPETESETIAETETANEDQSRKLTDAEKIQMLTEELRKSEARYSSLQGKYNAEVKKSKKQNATANSDDDKTADTPENGTGEYETDPGEDEELAEELGLDVDVAKAVRLISERQNAKLREELSALTANQRNSMLDREIRASTGGLTLDEVGGHPLFSRYAAGMKDGDGVTASQAIAEAKAQGDFRSMADIAAQVVSEMKAQGVWDLSGGHSAQYNAEPAKAPESPAAVKQVAKPSTVTPHPSGGVPKGQTARTIEQVEAELDAALARFRRDKSAAGDITRLNRELAQLEKTQR